MKRHQIRRMIPDNVSDAQVRRAIADLGLPADDNHDYSDDEAKQILNQFRGKQTESSPGCDLSPSTEVPTSLSQALTKSAIASSSDALTGQVKALATRMDASDRTLARQLAGYVADRPQRFTVMFAQELAALTAPLQDQTFIDVELAAVEMPDLRGDFLSIAASSALGCLPM